MMIKITGATLQQAIDHAVDGWDGDGRWLQIAGFAFIHNPDEETATELSILTPEGPRLVQPDDEIIAVVNEFLVDRGLGQDGYTFLSPEQVIPSIVDAINLKILIRSELDKSKIIQPVVEGRICNIQRSGPCLLGGINQFF